VTKPALQHAYEHFCQKYRLAVMSQTKFGSTMKKLGYFEGRTMEDGKRERAWRGIRLNGEYILVTSQGKQTKLA